MNKCSLQTWFIGLKTAELIVQKCGNSGENKSSRDNKAKISRKVNKSYYHSSKKERTINNEVQQSGRANSIKDSEVLLFIVIISCIKDYMLFTSDSLHHN